MRRWGSEVENNSWAGNWGTTMRTHIRREIRDQIESDTCEQHRWICVHRGQSSLTLGKDDAEWTNRIATTVRAGEEFPSVRVSMNIFLFKSYSQAQRQSHVRVVLAQDQLYIDEPYFAPNICQVAEGAISLRLCTGL